MTGILGGEWTLKEFTPMAAIPSTVKLTIYADGAEALDAEQFQTFVTAVEVGHQQVKIDRVFRFNEIREAHKHMENNQASGKLVVLVGSE